MKKFLYICTIFTTYFFWCVVKGNAQPLSDTLIPAIKDSTHSKGLFETDEVLNITLSGNLRELLNDRSENSEYHPLQLLYSGADSNIISIPVKIKTRGHFRKLRTNCFYPPLLINFSKSEALKSSVFKKQDKLKLVMPCKADDYVLREWLVYKLYNLITPKSFRARLVTVSLEDTKNKKKASPFYGILLEEEKQMAKRNHGILIEHEVKQENTDHDIFLTMAVFEYLIGNTDWSVKHQHNIKLLAADSNAIPATVPYDFDHSGLVGAPYALPAEELEMNSVRERRYRGYCIRDMKQFDSVIALYNKLKTDIYGIYTNNTLVDEKYIKATIKYFDEFYATLNNPAALQKEFGYPCYTGGTGNVIIKGLKED